MTNDDGTAQLAFVIRHSGILLCPRGEQKRKRYAGGCAKVAHHLDGRNQKLLR
jgi:hypothetical protein